MPRPPRHNRQQMLDKALALFWRQGFGATSLKDIEQALDMRPGSIYAAFGSKEALFREALGVYADQGRRALERALAKADSPLAGLADHVRTLGRGSDPALPSRACLLVKTLLELDARHAETRAFTDGLLNDLQRRFETVFARARDCGELPPEADPARLARRLQANIIGLRAYAERGIDPEALRQLADDMADDLLALRRPPAA